jgi:hypothetical protein
MKMIKNGITITQNASSRLVSEMHIAEAMMIGITPMRRPIPKPFVAVQEQQKDIFFLLCSRMDDNNHIL